MSQITREAVIEESIRHVKGLEHDHEDLCIFCCDNDYICPNPFIDINVPTALAYHSRGENHCMANICPICNPYIGKMQPDYWEDKFPKWKKEALRRRIRAKTSRGNLRKVEIVRRESSSESDSENNSESSNESD